MSPSVAPSFRPGQGREYLERQVPPTSVCPYPPSVNRTHCPWRYCPRVPRNPRESGPKRPVRSEGSPSYSFSLRPFLPLLPKVSVDDRSCHRRLRLEECKLTSYIAHDSPLPSLSYRLYPLRVHGDTETQYVLLTRHPVVIPTPCSW